MHENEMSNIIAVINLDCIGSDDLYVTETDSVNGFDLDQIISNAAQDLGITIALESPGGSDQETFRDPYWINYYIDYYWGVNVGISDATPLASSAMLDSYPLFYSDLWSMGVPGWIHTSYDNSTSTTTLDWVEVPNLGNHIKVAALTAIRISPNVTVGKPGDLNFDGVVNYKDAALFRQAYIGEYNYLADFNHDEVINYKDASLFRSYYIAG
jgi:hypothetical protein